MIRVFLFSIFMFAIAQAAAPAGWFTSARAAADAAKRQQLPIMIVFAGAEWSADSIEFRDKFLSNPEISRLIKANCVPLYVEIPPASAWTYKFKQRLRSSYAFLDLDIGIPLPMICFTNSNFKKLNVPEPDSNRNALRNALNASRIALEKIDRLERQQEAAARAERERLNRWRKEEREILRRERQRNAQARIEQNLPAPAEFSASSQQREANRQKKAVKNLRHSPPEGWFTDPEKAKEFAANRNLPIMILFSGTDWCPPCQNLRRSVLDQRKVQKLVTEKCVALYIHVGRESFEQVRKAYPFWNGRAVPSFVFTDAKFNILPNAPRHVEPSYEGVNSVLNRLRNNLK